MRRERLAKERTSRNLTQEKVAMDIGISTIYLRKLEGGQSKPGRETMLKLEQYYGVSVRELFPDIFPDIPARHALQKERGEPDSHV